MINRVFMLALILGLIAVPQISRAQTPRLRFVGGGVEASLLNSAAVQTELGLTDEQKERVREVRAQRIESPLTPEEMLRKTDELAKRTAEIIKTVLDEKQQQRLAQLRLQKEGPFITLARSETAEKLGLTKEQRERIGKIRDENSRQTHPLPPGTTKEDALKAQAESLARREKTTLEMIAVLTPEQKEAFEKLQGPRFTFSIPGQKRMP